MYSSRRNGNLTDDNVQNISLEMLLLLLTTEITGIQFDSFAWEEWKIKMKMRVKYKVDRRSVLPKKIIMAKIAANSLRKNLSSHVVL